MIFLWAAFGVIDIFIITYILYAGVTFGWPYLCDLLEDLANMFDDFD